jgi:hypothetical protein
VRHRVGHVRVLVRLEPARNLFGQPGRDRVVALGRIRLDGGGADHDLRAVRAQHRDLLLAHLVRHHEDAAVALERRGDCQADTGVPRRRLDDRPAGLEQPVALGRLDHGHADPVLHRPARIQILELGEQRRRDIAPDLVEADDRRPADELEDARELARHPP